MRASHGIIALIVLATALALVPLRCPGRAEAELLMTTWGMPWEDVLYRDTFARGFEKRHPGIRVNYQRYSDLFEKYHAWHVVGRGADVMRMTAGDYSTLVAAGMLEPLDSFIADPQVGLTPAEVADFFPTVWEALKINGHVYALPSDNAQYGMYYNKTLFDQYDAAHPDAPLGYPNANWTWEDLKRAADALTISGPSGEILQYGISFELWAFPFQVFFVQAGGRIWDDAKTTTYLNSPAGVEAMEFIASLIPRNAPIRSLELARTASGPDSLFKAGKVAIYLEGSWRAPDVENYAPHLDFAISSLPRHRQRGIATGSVLWGMSVHSRHKPQAWAMLRWLVAREQSLAYWHMLRVAPPCLASVVESEEFQATPGVVRDGKVLVPPMPREKFQDRAAWLLDAYRPAPDTGKPPAFLMVAPYERDLEYRLAAAMVQVIREGRPAKQALDEAVRDIHAIIDRDRKAKGLPPVVRER